MEFKKPDSLTEAILQTVAYADIFDYPLTLSEIHRYLIGCQTSMEQVFKVLHNRNGSLELISSNGEYYFLAGKEKTVELRRKRAKLAADLWQQALCYGRWIGHLPFVRMVGVTGALANNNVERNADLDFLIITTPGYLWLCRAMILVLTRLTAPFGATICPNYLLTANVLRLHERDLFTAQELARMVPISGISVYQKFRAANGWTDIYLPNSQNPPKSTDLNSPRFKPMQWIGEGLLDNPFGKRLEKWEMNRKIAKLSVHVNGNPEIHFSADHCKGHFEQHGSRILYSYSEKVSQIKDILS